jgi:Polyphosphate kinase 2 (PPK2)
MTPLGKLFDPVIHSPLRLILGREAIRATAAQLAPWYVVPADHKWFTRLIVAGAIGEAVDKLGLSYPQVDAEEKGTGYGK